MKIIFKDGTILELKYDETHIENGYLTYKDNHKLKGTKVITHDTHLIPLSNIKEIIDQGECNPNTQL